MFKSREVIRKSNVFYDVGQSIDMIEDLTEQERTHRLGSLVQEASWLSRIQMTSNKPHELGQTTRNISPRPSVGYIARLSKNGNGITKL